MRPTILAALILHFICCLSYGQQQPEMNSSVVLTSFHNGEEVLLRWAPTDKYLWRSALSKGYRLWRRRITKNGAITDTTAMTLLRECKPLPLPEWESYARIQPMAAVMAQSIYGAAMEFSASNGIYKASLENDVLERRFAFSLMAADLDFKTALMAGLAFRDSTIVRGESYLYELRVNEGAARAVAYVNTGSTDRLPQLAPPVAVVRDSVVHLSWEDHTGAGFVAYHVERSFDGQEFIRVNSSPVANFSPEEHGVVSFSDLPGREGRCWYRLRGIHIFGLESGVSERTEISMGAGALEVPEFHGYKWVDETHVELDYRLNSIANSSAMRVEVLRADRPDLSYTSVLDTLLPLSGKFTLRMPSRVSYLRLRSYDAYGRSEISPPLQIQYIDSVPPPAPEKLRVVTVDSTGLKLAWDPVEGDDVRGYHIFFAPSGDQSFVQLTKTLLPEPFYKTEHLGQSYDRGRFTVRAVDHRFNRSRSSDTLEVVFNAPLPAPVWRNYRSDPEGIFLEWQPLSEPSLQECLVYRRLMDNAGESRQPVQVIPAADGNHWVDTKVESGRHYRYALKIRSADGRESTISPEITLVASAINKEAGTMDLRVTPLRDHRSIALHWRLKKQEVAEIRIYRATDKGALTLYRTLTEPGSRISDTVVSPNTTYTYLMQVLYKNGESIYSREAEVTY